jgi:ethylbenzene dioxygenase subunit beta
LDETGRALTRVAVGSELYSELVEWLHREAELLDTGREREWLETMVGKAIVYRVPVRQTVERSRGSGFAKNTFHLDESYGSLASRVARNDSAYAWAEDPPSRIRHFVTNVRVAMDADGAFHVRSNQLIYRTRGEKTQPQILSGEKQDIIGREDGRLMLLRRNVLLDLSVIETHNLAIFF